jgi:hypothetical protein
MRSMSWLTYLLCGLDRGPKCRRRAARSPARRHLELECLEERTLLSNTSLMPSSLPGLPLLDAGIQPNSAMAPLSVSNAESQGLAMMASAGSTATLDQLVVAPKAAQTKPAAHSTAVVNSATSQPSLQTRDGGSPAGAETLGFFAAISASEAGQLLSLASNAFGVAQGLSGLFADDPLDRVIGRIDSLQRDLDLHFDNLGRLLNTEIQRDIMHQDQLADQVAISHAKTAENLLYTYKLTHQYDSLNSADVESSNATEFLRQQTDPFYIAGLIDAGNARIDFLRALDDYQRTHDPNYHGWAHDPVRLLEVNGLINSLAGMIDTVRNSVDLAHTITDDSENFPLEGETDYFYSHRHRGDTVNSWTYLITIPHEHPIAPYTQPQAWAAAQADRSRGIANELAYLSIPQFQSVLDTWRDLTKSFWVTPTTTTPTAGTPFNVTVAARDSHGNLITGYTGTVHFSSSDSQAGLPADYRFTTGPGADNGVHTFQVTLKTAGARTITATDTATSTPLNADSAAVNVSPAAASRFALSAPASIQAGQSFSLPVTAYDPYGNVATGYTGMVHFTSNDGQAVLPADYRFTTGPGGDNGVHTLNVTLKTAGDRTVTVSDTTGSPWATVPITVTPAAATTFQVNGYPSPTTAGVEGTFIVTALDPYGNVDTGYRGTVHSSSSDGRAALPADYRFTTDPGGDNGVHTFRATLATAGGQSITATDTQSPGITGSETGIVVTPAAPSRFDVNAPASSVAGTSFPITVTAYDPYNNLATNYTGTVRFDSSDSQDVLPHDSSLTNGVGTFSVTLKTAGSQSVTVTDTILSAQGSATVAITPAAASRLSLSAPAGTVAGVPFTITVTAYDSYGNVATGYTGLVHFISSDPQAVLPPDYRFTTGPVGDNGVHTFTLTLNAAGDQNIIVFDLTNINLLTGATVTVTSGGGAGGSASGSRPRVAVTEADGPSWTERSVSPVDRATVERFFAAAAQVNPENVFARSKPHRLGLAEDVWWDLALSPDVI